MNVETLPILTRNISRRQKTVPYGADSPTLCYFFFGFNADTMTPNLILFELCLEISYA